MKDKKPLYIILTFIAQVIVYLVVSIPFKVMEVIPGFTDIRPVTLLGPIYAVFFGPQGCLAFAVGNLITDIVSDSLRWSCIAGFIANFGGPYLIYLYWTRISKEDFSLRTGKNILKHIAVVIITAVITSAIITPSVAIAYPDVDAAFFSVVVVLNTAGFPIVLGIPLIFLMQEELGFEPVGRKKAAKAEK